MDSDCKKVLQRLSGAGFTYDVTTYDFGGERYLKTGETLPDSALEEVRGYDAIFLGAIGHPDVPPGVLEQGILLRARFDLDLYINLRPVKLFPGVETPIKNKGPEDIDFVVVRENTEGLYASTGGFLRKGTANEIGDRDYPGVTRDYAHVDAICMWFLKNPEWFDVIVTDNMFGDIITDLAAMIQGGLGVAAGANINPQGTGMFEPMGGSAPKYAGKDAINPIAAVAAVQMMLDHLVGRTPPAGWKPPSCMQWESWIRSPQAGWTTVLCLRALPAPPCRDRCPYRSEHPPGDR